ncbi:MAG: type II secretion system ATPase GspE [candidate division KSB1 bacterium]|nr:type II secretion system ATPase GspE [candidate division KSB1 bacterium]
MAKKNVLLGDFLVEQGLITEEQLRKALAYQQKAGKLLGRSLIELGFIGEEELIKALSEQLGVQYVSLKNYRIDPEVVKLVPEELARNYRLIPLFAIEKTLTVAMANPLDVVAIDALSRTTGMKVEPVVCSEEEIAEAIEHYYGGNRIRSALRDLQLPLGKEEELEQVDEQTLRREAEEGPIIKLVNLILEQAVQDGASDIHVEPLEDRVRIRYRIDGVLHEVHSAPKAVQLALTSRLKILSDLNIAERRVPQDGRFRLHLQNREIDFRVSTLPTAFGEKVVLRILDKKKTIRLHELGLDERELAILRSLLKRPHGMILVTGPTGSGKTTTLYAALMELDRNSKNIVTLEDPIEYQLEGVSQSQVNPKIGLTFAAGLRSILRQDPDIVMVGEIRDLETAQISVQAALTGHLLLSTLHTNDAAGAVTRLIDMGVEPYLIASSVQGVVAQRLLRRVCPNCAEPWKPPAELLESLQVSLDPDVQFVRGKGCIGCKQLGYKGRIAIYEILVMDDELRELVLRRAPSTEIRNLAIRKGMRTLREAGLRKAAEGITTLDEVFRVTQLD